MKPKMIVSGWHKVAKYCWDNFRREINNPSCKEYMCELFVEQAKIRQTLIHPEELAAEIRANPTISIKDKVRCWDIFAEYIADVKTPWHGFRPPPPRWHSSTGGRTLFEIWKFEPKEVYIAGFDFCTKDWDWNASVHDYMKEAEMVMDMCASGRVELSEHTKRSLSSVKIF
jgi:hypothetical protein